MNKFNPAEKFWFALCRNAEGGEGGGAVADTSGSPVGEAAAVGVAGAEAAAPASTFLNGAVLAEAPPAEGEAKPEGEAKAEGEVVAEAPPEFNLAGLKLPEGFELSEELGKSFSDLLGNKDLSAQDRGQQLIDLHTKTVQETAAKTTEALLAANKEAYTKMNNDWREGIKSLPEFKADPDGEAGKVLQVLTTMGAGKEFFAAMDLTGAGNNPAILQVLHRLAKPHMEGAAVGGGAKPASTKKLGDNIYTSSNKS